MTLKEKFKQWLDTEPRIQIREVQLEVIADDYAIEFAEWIDKKNYGIEIYKHLKTYKEILKIFKKEKGF